MVIANDNDLHLQCESIMHLLSPPAFISRLQWLPLILVAWSLQACGGGNLIPSEPPLSDVASLGREIFKDVTLSASGQMSCATCHVPERGHASPFESPVAMGAKDFRVTSAPMHLV